MLTHNAQQSLIDHDWEQAVRASDWTFSQHSAQHTELDDHRSASATVATDGLHFDDGFCPRDTSTMLDSCTLLESRLQRSPRQSLWCQISGDLWPSPSLSFPTPLPFLSPSVLPVKVFIFRHTHERHCADVFTLAV